MSKRYRLEWGVDPNLPWVRSTESNFRWYVLFLYHANRIWGDVNYRVIDTKEEA